MQKRGQRPKRRRKTQKPQPTPPFTPFCQQLITAIARRFALSGTPLIQTFPFPFIYLFSLQGVFLLLFLYIDLYIRRQDCFELLVVVAAFVLFLFAQRVKWKEFEKWKISMT
jgi:hypothetical protein